MRTACRAARLGLVAALLGPPASAAAQALQTTAPCRVMRAAARAVAAGSTDSLRSTLRERAAHSPDDRAALLGLAALDLWTGQLTAADSAFRAIAVLSGNDAATHCAKLGAAFVLLSQGRWSAASAAFTRVAAEAREHGDRLLEVGALLELVQLESRGRALDAAAHLARADSLIPPDDAALRAQAMCVRASLLGATHGASVAAVAADGAAMARAAGEPMTAVECELSAATDEALRGHMEVAAHEFAVVIADARASHALSLEAIALQWRGYVHLTLGSYGAAEDELQRALVLSRPAGMLAVVGWSELNLAALFGSVGDWPNDLRHAALAHAVLAAIGDSAGLGILRRGEGRAALESGDTASARASFQVALDAANRTGRKADIIAALTAMADVELREGHSDRAAALLRSERALISPGAQSGWELLLPLMEARVHLAQGDWSAALRDLAAAEPALAPSQHLFRFQLRQDRALAELGLGDSARAIATLEGADDDLDAWRAKLGTRDLQMLAFQSVDIIGTPSDASAIVTAAAARMGRIATAFALAERRRARKLADDLWRADALRRAIPGDSVPAGARGATGAPPVTLALVERSIPDDSTAILYYVTGAGKSPTTLIVITRRGARARLLAPEDSLSDAIDRYDALVDQGVAATSPASELGAALITPELAGLPRAVRRLVFVPDGLLDGVAFGALRMPDGSPLLNRAAIAVAPSATVLVDIWSRAQRARPPAILAFGDPTPPQRRQAGALDATDSSTAIDHGAAEELDMLGQLPRLPGTAEEARIVGAFAPGSVVRLDSAASAAYLETTPLSRFSIIHFATHAVVDQDFPLRSAIVLAPGGGLAGFVGPGNLAALALTADVVVLSGCRTARGRIVSGEGVRGLTAPLLAAGARSVLATRWRLDDRDAVPLVSVFYRGLADGLTVSEAARRAALWAIKRGAPEREWAALELVGDPSVRVDLRRP